MQLSKNFHVLGKFLFALCVLVATFGANHAAVAETEYLEPAQAFKFSAKMVDGKTVAVTYLIADGYYMYRERFKFAASGARLGAPVFPRGKIKFDETYQKEVETFRNSVTVTIPVDGNGSFQLSSTGQGCADQGLCYAPMESVLTLDARPAPKVSAQIAPAAGAALAAPVSAAAPAARRPLPASVALIAGPASASAPAAAVSAPATVIPPAIAVSPAATSVAAPVAALETAPAGGTSEAGAIEASLKSGRLLAILPLFLLLGLGLSLTPCVLPMVPILSFIIVGEGSQVGRPRAFLLSLTYALGMALVYTALGVAAGLAGEGLAATLQNPWVLGAFAILMALLSGSMFGLYELQVPSSLQSKLVNASEKQRSGKLFGVFAMGAISALIVGPCVAAPLAGALLYISQTRDVVIGGAALFSMAIGMSVPLLLVGLSAGSLLPRAGAWMEGVKRFFGVLMLAMALWLVSPVLPAVAQMFGWAALGLGYGMFLLRDVQTGWRGKAFGVLCVLIGVLQISGIAAGGRDPWAPLAHLGGGNAGRAPHVTFVRVKSNAELEQALRQASGKVVMFDFYADWCVSCKEMEKLTFSDARVQARLDEMVLLQADVTANNDDDKGLLKRFKLFGPPGIIFFDRAGQELPGARVIGYQNAEHFLTSLSRAQ